MKVVILAGGCGTRLSEYTESIPKPMVTIGGRPILWHIMKLFAKYRLQSHLSKHQLKIVLYLVVHILPLKILFLLTYFLYILVRQATYQEFLVHISRYQCVYQKILVREMLCTRNFLERGLAYQYVQEIGQQKFYFER